MTTDSRDGHCMWRAFVHLTTTSLIRSRSMSTSTASPLSTELASSLASNELSFVSSGHSGPVAARLRERIVNQFAPTHLEIHNESHNHAAALESHFKLVVISDVFEGMMPSPSVACIS